MSCWGHWLPWLWQIFHIFPVGRTYQIKYQLLLFSPLIGRINGQDKTLFMYAQYFWVPKKYNTICISYFERLWLHTTCSWQQTLTFLLLNTLWAWCAQEFLIYLASQLALNYITFSILSCCIAISRPENVSLLIAIIAVLSLFSFQ